jgi:hypothetical protein
MHREREREREREFCERVWRLPVRMCTHMRRRIHVSYEEEDTCVEAACTHVHTHSSLSLREREREKERDREVCERECGGGRYTCAHTHSSLSHTHTGS